MTKRVFRGCKCRCGQGTWGNYAPGHDARHVAQWVRRTILETDLPWERGQVWQAAMRDLPTDALRAKYRSAMYRSADRHLYYAIERMNDEVWQIAIHLQALLSRDDSYFDRNARFNSRVLATWAAALGWTRQAVNTKRS